MFQKNDKNKSQLSSLLITVLRPGIYTDTKINFPHLHFMTISGGGNEENYENE